MDNLDFLLSCILALVIVFLVLFVLSVSIRLIITIFPEKPSDDDTAVIAAITTHMGRVYPHSQITKLEEQK